MSLNKRLIKAIRELNVEEVKSLLEKRASANTRSSDNDEHYNKATALFLAVKKSNTEIIELLLKHGANINDGSYKNGKLVSTPLHCTVIENHEKTAMFLIANGADIHAKDGNGSTPLQFAASCGKEKFVKLFLDIGASVHTENMLGWSPLFTAMLFCPNPQIVKLLLEHGANVTEIPVTSYLQNRFQQHWKKPELRNKLLGSFFLLLLYGADVNVNCEYTREKINNTPKLRNCLTAVEEIKEMPHLDKLIEVNKRRDIKENTKIISQYINDGAKKQELITEFKTIGKKYNCGNQLSFIPKCLFNFVEYLSQQYLSEYEKDALKTGALAGIISAVVLSTKNLNTELYDLEVKNYRLDNKDILNLRLVCKRANEDAGAYYKKCKAKVQSLLTPLKEIVYGSPKRSLDEVAIEQGTSKDIEPLRKGQYMSM